MKILSVIFGIVCGGFVGAVLGFFPAACVDLLFRWANPDDPSDTGAWVLLFGTVPGGAVLGAVLGRHFITTRPQLFRVTILPLAILFVGLPLTHSALESIDVPRNYVLKVAGPQGADFIGEVRVDGQFHKLNGNLPAEFEYQALEVEFAFALPNAKEGEKIVVEVFIDGKKKWHVKEQSETRFAGKYKSFGYSDSPAVWPFGGTSVWSESDLLPEQRPAPRK
jgi:hypothetical protein